MRSVRGAQGLVFHRPHRGPAQGRRELRRRHPAADGGGARLKGDQRCQPTTHLPANACAFALRREQCVDADVRSADEEREVHSVVVGASIERIGWSGTGAEAIG